MQYFTNEGEFYERYWSKEICQEATQQGATLIIDHWIQTPIVTNEVTIIEYALQHISNKHSIAKINEMQMKLGIVYMSEIEGRMYTHYIKFPPVKVSNAIRFH